MDKPVEDILSQTGRQNLQIILKQVAELKQIATCLDDVLDANLRQHCEPAKLSEDGRLTLIVDSPTWASVLRYQLPLLLSQLKQQPTLRHAGLASIDYLVRPKDIVVETQTNHSEMPPMSTDSADLIKNTAEGIECSELKEALERLASHAN